MTKIFGIKNCDTVKKARQWLDSHAVDYEFHDVRSDGLTEDQVQAWLAKVDWQLLVNKRSTTWKQLAEEVKEKLSESNVTELLLSKPTLIKRPVLEYDNGVFIGFKAADYDSIFAP